MIPDPRTGRVNTRSTLAASTVQLNKQERIDTIPVLRETSNEAINVMLPPSDDRPRTCRARIARDTDELELNVPSDKGAYKVQPAEMPSSREIASTINIEAVTRAYKEPRLTRGSTKSAARYD